MFVRLLNHKEIKQIKIDKNLLFYGVSIGNLQLCVKQEVITTYRYFMQGSYNRFVRVLDAWLSFLFAAALFVSLNPFRNKHLQRYILHSFVVAVVICSG